MLQLLYISGQYHYPKCGLHIEIDDIIHTPREYEKIFIYIIGLSVESSTASQEIPKCLQRPGEDAGFEALLQLGVGAMHVI